MAFDAEFPHSGRIRRAAGQAPDGRGNVGAAPDPRPGRARNAERRAPGDDRIWYIEDTPDAVLHRLSRGDGRAGPRP
jgi:hypothetical protein